MKKITRSLNVLAAGITLLCVNSANATTYTATGTGNWSDASTWAGGIAPGTYITSDTIVIPASAMVLLDVDVEFNGITALLSLIDGSLLKGLVGDPGFSTTLTMNSGKLSGAGMIDLYSVVISGNTAVPLGQLGNIFAEKLRFSTSYDINLACNMQVSDSLFFTAGQVGLMQGDLTIGPDAWVVMEGGSIVQSLVGGDIYADDPYNVLYRGAASETSGIELTWNEDVNLQINFDDNDQALTLGMDAEVNNVSQIAGGLDLNGKNLEVNGDYINSSSRAFRGSPGSGLSIYSASGWTANLAFETGAEDLENLLVKTGNAAVKLSTNLRIYNELSLESGSLRLVDSTLQMKLSSTILVNKGILAEYTGNFNGVLQYNVKYTGISLSTGTEMSGPGLHSLTIDLQDAENQIMLTSNYTIPGDLNLLNGVLNLGEKTLKLTGGFTSEATGAFHSNTSSILNIIMAEAFEDTIHFTPTGNYIHIISINLADEGAVTIDSDLLTDSLSLVNGSVQIIDNTLTIIDIPVIAGANEDSYIMINGTGKLKMTLYPTSSAFTIFPVGTPDNYAPALIKPNGNTLAAYTVNVLEGVYQYGDTVDVTASQSVVNNTWNIGSFGATTDIDLKVRWSAGMELNGFDRTNAGISRYINPSWDYPELSGATSVSGMYELTRAHLTTLGTFAVADGEATLEVPESGILTVGVYPNPANEEVNVSIDGAAKIELIDAYGKIVSTAYSTASGTLQMNLASLPSGMYYVRANANGLFTTQKVIKK